MPEENEKLNKISKGFEITNFKNLRRGTGRPERPCFPRSKTGNNVKKKVCKNSVSPRKSLTKSVANICPMKIKLIGCIIGIGEKTDSEYNV